MPALQLESFGDLLKTTQKELGEPNYTDLMSDLQDCPAAKTLINKHKMSVQSGTSIQWDIAVNHGSAASNVAITDHDQLNITDGMIQAEINWRKTQTNYAFHHEELSANRSERRIVDLIKFRRTRARVSWIEMMENNFWRFPAAADTRTPLGLPYYCTKNATTGFNGGIPTGYSSVANVSPTTYSRWNNYTYQYTDVTLDDFILNARTMATKTGFKPHIDGIPTFNKGDANEYFTTLSVRQKLENVVDTRNDNLGNDIAKNDDNVYFRRAPVKWVPRLEEDTTNPFYQINWGVFGMIVMQGWWMKETTLDPYPGQRNVVGVFVDCLYNFICRDRRRLGVMATGTSYP